MKKPRNVPYGIASFATVIKDDFVFVDKTKYIESLESISGRFLFFLRPRRFGKSLFISMLQHYYGAQYKDQFAELFGHLYIGKNPTPNANAYGVLIFDFSKINTDTEGNTFEGFNEKIKRGIQDFNSHYRCFTKEEYQLIITRPQAGEKMEAFFGMLVDKNFPHKIYILIDEYDHFANEIIAFNFKHFSEIISRNGYVRKFYETIKTATRDGIVERFFATGVTPITLDSLTSGFNITKDITLRPAFNEMMGFTEDELRWVIGEACEEGKYNEDELVASMKELYNGSKFHPKGKERLYNSDMVLYFLSEYVPAGYEFPERLLDKNIASDYSKIERMALIQNPAQNLAVLEEIIFTGEIDTLLTEQYNFERAFTVDDFLSLLFYNGFLTIKEERMSRRRLQIPNYVIRELYWAFFLEILIEREKVTIDTRAISAALEKLALDNDMQAWVAPVEEVLKQLSNRDSLNFDEKHLKMIFVSYTVLSNLYIIKSEWEFAKGYADLLLLFRSQYRPNYQFLIELKYLEKEEEKKLASVTEKAAAQIEKYRKDEYIKQLENLKCWVVVFVGDEARVVKEIVS